MPTRCSSRLSQVRGFTLIEILAAIAVTAVLVTVAGFFVVSYVGWAKETADKQTLAVLNDALTRYKTEGGDITALTQNAPISHVLTKMASTISWAGMSHNVMQSGVTYPARSLTAIGNGANYQFTKYNTYQAGFDTSTAILGALSAQGTPGDANTPAWVASSLATTGVKTYLVLSQPSTSLVIGMYLRGTGTLCVNWGDGNTQNYTLSGSDTAVTHTYGSSSTYGVTMVGNVTYLQSYDRAALGGTGCCSYGGDISTMTGMTYLFVQGSNTLSGSVSSLTSLTTLSVTGSNTLSGSVSNLTGLTYLYVDGSNTVTGSVSAMSGLTFLFVLGNNTLSGSMSGMPSLQYVNVQGSNTITGWEDVAANAPGLCSLYQRGNTILTSAQVNAVLAGFWANKDVAKPRAERGIGINNAGNGAPTGQGITDKANLQAYKSPNGTGPMVWSVGTN